MSVASSSVTATVSPVAPGAGTPTGTVGFYVAGTQVGSAPLTGGTATLAYVVPAGSTQQVSVVYTGDSSFTGSSATTARQDPVITATVSSSKARQHGWYAGPVTVTFHCQATSAALTAACPAPVTLTRNAAGQSVTRTVLATDGGVATVAVSGINIDAVRPVARLTGVRAGATYFVTGPVAHCRATDTLSGVARCTVTRTTHGHQVVYVATATDSAGNRSQHAPGRPHLRVTISGAAMRGDRLRRPPRPHLHDPGRFEDAPDLRVCRSVTARRPRRQHRVPPGRARTVGTGRDLHGLDAPPHLVEHRHPRRLAHHGHRRARRELTCNASAPPLTRPTSQGRCCFPGWARPLDC